MSSKLTELTDSYPSAQPPSVLCGSGILSRLASSGYFDPGQTYDGYRAVEVLDPPCTEFLAKGKDCFQNFNPKSSKSHFCFVGKKPCCCPGTSCSQPPAKRFQSCLTPSTPRNFQPTLAAIPTSLPHSSARSSHTRPGINPALGPSSIQQSRASPIVTSQQLQPEASPTRGRQELSPLPFPETQVFQQRYCWPIHITREDPNLASENQDAVARLLRQVDRNSREIIMYANDRTIPGTAS
ncbi:hypothetical protein O181_032036 [Austropuccinia psidii MF-1]|uniref:Uncharacterized protein n=1 Tax=Austropuccinia psidii MF-1 TaxID=1389203 RepID=A0A9Q3D1M9_9BASI|nr:hypothetical protein [Austropuccinia psidii MF-1]